MKQDPTTVLARLTEAFPQTFVLEKHRPHRPLKVGISADIRTRLPELSRYKLNMALAAYTRRVMYLESMVAGAARIDLDGNVAGEVTAKDEAHAAARLADIMASREARRATAVKARIEEQVAKPAATVVTVAPPVAKTLKERPVLRLPAFRQKFG